MRRAVVERQRTLRVWRNHNLLVHAGTETGCVCDKQPGRFRKGQKVAGCGKSRCWLCKSEKLAKRPTARDHRQELRYKEWSSEYGYSRAESPGVSVTPKFKAL